MCDYLVADLEATQQLADKLMLRLNRKEDAGLRSTVDLTNQVAVCLARIYQRGFTVDKQALDNVRVEFEKERNELTDDLQAYVRKLMGDTPINLNSPEQLSWVVYSRKVEDKQFWSSRIDPYMDEQQFRSLVASGTEKVYKTRATQCKICNGAGYVRKTKKNGEPFAKPNRCTNCNAAGYTLTSIAFLVKG